MRLVKTLKKKAKPTALYMPRVSQKQVMIKWFLETLGAQVQDKRGQLLKEELDWSDSDSDDSSTLLLVKLKVL